MTLVSNGITFHGLYKLWPMECPVTKPFIDNEKFLDIKDKYDLPTKFNKRSLFTPQGWSYTGDYKFHIGPSFYNNLCYWRCDEIGLFGSFCRLACKRFLDKDPSGRMHDEYAENQRLYFTEANIDNITSYFIGQLDLRHSEDDIEEQRRGWVYAPHPKKKERVSAFEKLQKMGVSHIRFVKEVEYVSKSQEWLPCDKYLRGTGNLGVVSAIAGGYLATHIKNLMKEELTFAQVRVQFVTVLHEEIENTFKQLCMNDDCYIAYFSDDSIISARCSDGYLRANLDVSQCDGSMGPEFLAAVKRCIHIKNWSTDIDELFRQLQLPMRLRSPYNKQDSILLHNSSTVLYSGSTLTTICNNFVHVFIANEYSKVYSSARTIVENQVAYEQVAKKLGFFVKVQHCARICDYQFLKLSPVGETYIVNIACHLRGFGFSKGDIPGKRRHLSIYEVGCRFLASIVQGRLNWGNTSLLQVFVEKYQDLFSTSCYEGTIRDDLTRPIGRYIEDYEWLERYDITEAEYSDFLELFRKADVGDCLHHTFISKVMAKDY